MFAYLRALFFENSEEFGKKAILGQPPSGKVLAVPNTAKVGALRNSNMPQQGRIYWMFFGNNGVVKKGDKVSVVIGDFRADDLIME